MRDEGAADSRQGKAVDKEVDQVRLADSAKCENLDGGVRRNFSLLPLEKFNLDRGKCLDSKKEEEEKRCYRLIPRSFTNWLQAFIIWPVL